MLKALGRSGFWSNLNGNESYMLRVLNNKMVTRIFAPKNEGYNSGTKNVKQSFVVCFLNQILVGNKMKEDEVGGIYSMHAL